MQVQSNPLEPFFHQAVRSSYEGRLGLAPAITSYVSHMLCEFAEQTVFSGCTTPKAGRSRNWTRWCALLIPIHRYCALHSLRSARFASTSATTHFFSRACVRRRSSRIPDGKSTKPTLAELIRVGKESYYIVSQFNVFEYEKEAALFGQPVKSVFEHCILGLAIARRDLWRTINPPAPVN